MNSSTRRGQVCRCEQIEVQRYNIYGTMTPLAALFSSINVHCTHARVSEHFSPYKLGKHFDGYASPKLIPHEILQTKKLNERKKSVITVRQRYRE